MGLVRDGLLLCLSCFCAGFLDQVGAVVVEVGSIHSSGSAAPGGRGTGNESSHALPLKRRGVSFLGRQLEQTSKPRHIEGRCFTPYQVTGSLPHRASCPAACPLQAEDTRQPGFCNFICVQSGQQCKAVNPDTSVADQAAGICRTCRVTGCKVCAGNGLDVCSRCESGFHLVAGGRCETDYKIPLIITGVVVAVIVVALVAWLVDICRRPITNEDALVRGLRFRTRSKIHMPVASTPSGDGIVGTRYLWPLATNLLREDVAGPGMILHFNFQLAIILWAFAVLGAWLLLGYAVDSELFYLGTREARTPREYCVLIQRGRSMQAVLLWAKSAFLVCLYVCTFVFCLAYSVYQLRCFQHIDEQEQTMKDYVALCSGLPVVSGESFGMEQSLKSQVSSLSGQSVVGVSICWDYGDRQDEVLAAVDKDLQHLRAVYRGVEDEAPRPKAEGSGFWRRKCLKFEDLLIGDLAEAPTEEAICDLLRELKTSGEAFIVFETELARDAAVRLSAQNPEGGFRLEDGSLVKLVSLQSEPNTVNWANFSPRFRGSKLPRVATGFLKITAVMFLWVFVFFEPTAKYVMSTSFSHGNEPSEWAMQSLGLVETIGNNIMYAVSANVASCMKFRFSDKTEAAYTVLYFFSVLISVAFDLWIIYRMAYKAQIAMDVPTHDGTPLAQVTSFAGVFNSYAMQMELGKQVMLYAFPSTFLTGFLVEPLVNILLPLKVSSLLVRTHPEVQASTAEQMLMCGQMDLTRYGDILVNMAIAVLIFFFPGGLTIKMFLTLALCHIFVFCYDHYRVLRAIPKCAYASMVVDWWTQLLLSIPCGLILACIVFKGSCHDGETCETTENLRLRCLGVFLAHVLVHCLLVIFAVPLLAPERSDETASQTPYRETAKRRACSWFNSNPVHCLRSKYVHHHSPPCVFFSAGKEHLLEQNEKIGCYYKQKDAAATENFEWMVGNKS